MKTEYSEITNKEEITSVPQIAKNELCDYARGNIMSNFEEAI